MQATESVVWLDNEIQCLQYLRKVVALFYPTLAKSSTFVCRAAPMYESCSFTAGGQWRLDLLRQGHAINVICETAVKGHQS